MENVVELLKNTEINEHTIKLKEGEQSLFEPIYSLGLVELEILKIYIKINLANSFIWRFKSPARALILFYRKSDKNLYLFIDCWSFNNLTIKNQYLLPLIDELLDQLG